MTFAVRAESEVVDLNVVGVILMLAGVAVMHHARKATVEESVVTQVEKEAEPGEAPHRTEERVVRRSVHERSGEHGEHGMRRH